MGSIAVGWCFALLLGVRHASEPDHLAAVSTMLAEQPRVGRGAVLGAFWGVGHSLSLMAVGGALFALRRQMPGRLADGFELVVAAMLLALGLRALLRAARGMERGGVVAHSHGGYDHEHPAPTAHVHLGPLALARRPLAVGLIHGVAGSGALTALALASMPSLAAGLIYMLCFGLGSVLGMALLTGLAGWPLQRLAAGPRARIALSAAAGVVSLGLGVAWGWPLISRLAGA